MPDIPGLPALITMLFTPVMELRSDKIDYALDYHGTLKRELEINNRNFSLFFFLFGFFFFFRTNEERTCYTGALCGLGWNSQTKEAILPNRDIELAFDVKFDIEDIYEVRERDMFVVMMTSTFFSITFIL